MKTTGISELNLLKQTLGRYTRIHEDIAENIANINEPNYQRKRINFSEFLDISAKQRLQASSDRHIIASETPDRFQEVVDDQPVDITEEMGNLAMNQIRFDFNIHALRHMYEGLMQSINGRSR